MGGVSIQLAQNSGRLNRRNEERIKAPEPASHCGEDIKLAFTPLSEVTHDPVVQACVRAGLQTWNGY